MGNNPSNFFELLTLSVMLGFLGASFAVSAEFEVDKGLLLFCARLDAASNKTGTTSDLRINMVYGTLIRN
jgi:hypothetical protein